MLPARKPGDLDVASPPMVAAGNLRKATSRKLKDKSSRSRTRT
jgi:hypothetical protein